MASRTSNSNVRTISCFKAIRIPLLKFRAIEDHTASANLAATNYFALLLYCRLATYRTDEGLVRFRNRRFVRTGGFSNRLEYRAAESSIHLCASLSVQRFNAFTPSTSARCYLGGANVRKRAKCPLDSSYAAPTVMWNLSLPTSPTM
jgi:hypothetical protein